MIEIMPFGDRALLINFKQEIDQVINQEVVSLANHLKDHQIEGMGHLIPGYCSITVNYDPLVIQYEDLHRQLEEHISAVDSYESKAPRVINLPVCYGPEYAPDLPEVMGHTHLSEGEIVALHTTTAFRVFMIGFLPGFTYMGILPKKLGCPRKLSPRLKVPARSVGLAGLQTGIYPLDAPGGWQIIGQTPIDIFDGQNENPFLFRTGDQVRFQAITPAQYADIRNQVEQGNYQKDQLYG